MLHIWYRMIDLVRSRALMFWLLAFPVILGTLFYFMFGGIDEVFQFEEIPVGIVGAKEEPELVKLMEQIQSEDETKLFLVTCYDEEEKALKDLKEEKLAGVLDVTQQERLIVTESNINTSILKTFLDEYQQNRKLIMDMAETNPKKVGELVSNLIKEPEVTIVNIPLKGVDKNFYTQYFFALIAMTCFTTSMLGLKNGCDVQANLSALAARRNIAPTKKMLQVIQDFIASFLMSDFILVIVVLLCIYGFKQDFGGNIPLVLLGGFVGNFTGIAVGTCIALMIKGNKSKKEGYCVLFYMGTTFLAGLQWADITYYLEIHCPIVNRINPATLLVNAFKSLSVFGDVGQYEINIITLFGIGVVCLVVSGWKLRRVRYASL